MVEITSVNGNVVLEDSVIIKPELAQVVKDPKNREILKNVLADLRIDHRIEFCKEGHCKSIASKIMPNRFVYDEKVAKTLTCYHIDLIEILKNMRKKEEPAKEEKPLLDVVDLPPLAEMLIEAGAKVLIIMPKK